MFGSLVYDAFTGLGCATFTLAVMGLAGFALALWLGLLPGLAARLKKLGKPDKEDAP